jgi:hypothetical protein
MAREPWLVCTLMTGHPIDLLMSASVCSSIGQLKRQRVYVRVAFGAVAARKQNRDRAE